MEKLGFECDEFPDTEAGIVQRRDDRLVPVAEVRRRVAAVRSWSSSTTAACVSVASHWRYTTGRRRVHSGLALSLLTVFALAVVLFVVL
ncbi:MAG: hypothetical protein J07HX64_01656 [halophilic archaeon J07HX64]|nr:MAG: hypothetical protein J07HX64_01656 [halophilic archaeon J07HX64]